MCQNNSSGFLLGLTRVYFPIYYIYLQMIFNYIYYFISVVKIISLNNCRVIFLNNCTDYVIFLIRYFNGFPRAYKKKLKFTCKILLFHTAVASFYFGSLYGRIMHLMFPRWHIGKESACHCRRCKRSRFNPWVRKISWRRKW